MPRAVVVRETGGPEVLRYEEWDPGAPKADEVRVRVRASGLNFIDVYFRTGLYPRPLPFVLGNEGSGVVESVGEGVRGLEPGTRVAWAGVPDSYAEVVLAPAERVVSVPDGVGDELAAAVMLQGMTAHYLVQSTRETKTGDWALVHAAAGGVGLVLVQMLKRAGARVIGTCSSAEKEKLAREAGCDHVVRYDQQEFAEAVRRLTEGRGVDVAYDSVGQATFEGSLRSLRVRGLMVLYGQSSGPVPPFDLQRLNRQGSLFITRPSLAHYSQDREELLQRANALFEAISSGELSVHIGARFGLSDAAQAHRALEGRLTTGKVLLLPD